MKVQITLALLLATVAYADNGLSMKCQVVVPEEYKQTPFNPPPNGEPEPVRYTAAYEAFWWNCVAVRAADLQARCKFQASGTPAATAGAADGAENANAQITALLRKHSRRAVRKYLHSISSQSEAKEKMRRYFLKPTPEIQK
jgi:hypothetical protein